MRRFGLDILLLLLFILTMGFRLLAQTWHEVLGLALLVGMLVHLWLNRRWFTSWLRGRWGRVRVLQTVMNVLLLVSSLVALGTGMVISNHVLVQFLIHVPLHHDILVHQLHIASSFVMLAFLGMHIGMHWRGLWQRLRRVPVLGRLDAHPVLRGWLLVLLFWGGCAYARLDHMGDRLLLRHIFSTPASQLPVGVSYLLLVCLLALFAILFYYLQAHWQQKAQAKRAEEVGAR